MQTKLLKQFNSKEIALRSSTYRYRRSRSAQELQSDIYPFLSDYLHELNPVLTSNLLEFEQINSFHAATIRDGSLLFADFLLKNISQISTLRTKLYIQENLAPLVPENFRDHFGIWKLTQNQQKKETYKTLLIAGIISDFTIDLTKLDNSLRLLKDYDFDVISVFLPTRKSPFEFPWLENYITNETIELIKSYYPNKKIKNIKTRELLEATSWKDTLALDVLNDTPIIADNYVNFEILSRGGDISHINHEQLENAEFNLDISFYHQIQYAPFPQCKSVFPDLLFLKKTSKQKSIFLDQEIVNFITNIKL